MDLPNRAALFRIGASLGTWGRSAEKQLATVGESDKLAYGAIGAVVGLEALHEDLASSR